MKVISSQYNSRANIPRLNKGLLQQVLEEFSKYFPLDNKIVFRGRKTLLAESIGGKCFKIGPQTFITWNLCLAIEMQNVNTQTIIYWFLVRKKPLRKLCKVTSNILLSHRLID